MSYEPSHRRPPRQERWPNATPGEGWPAYQQDGGSSPWESAAALAGSRNGYDAPGATRHGGQGQWGGGYGYGGATAAYPAVGGGYAGEGYGDGFDGAVDGYRSDAGGYGAAQDNYATQDNYEDPSGWDGYTQPGHEFTGPAIYSQPDEYPALDPAASVLVAPDTLGEWWRADRSRDGGEERGHRGAIVGVTMGVLAAAVTIGVATLAAAFVRPQASPVRAVSGVFTDRIPASLKHHLTAQFGAHGQTVLLIGVIGLLAVVLGFMARRNVSIAVAGIAAFGLLGAFVAVTRPESRPSDVIPSAIGGLAGIVALLWLARASAPVASLRPAYGGNRRRAR